MREHEFRYRIAMAYIDLDELPDAARRPPHRASAPGSCASAAATTSAIPRCRSTTPSARSSPSASARAPQGPIRLLTHLRTFGHCFNPVSFYYCFAPDGEQLEAIVAEVTNTPWGERHAYVLQAGDPIPRGGFDKALHVSPFMPMDQRYTWRAPAPGRDAVGPDREQRRTATRPSTRRSA